jgi:DNA-binding MarR family transcriptional regulator
MLNQVQFSQTLRTWMDVFMHRSMRGWSHFARSTGLSMPQISILIQLYHKGPCGMSEISERFEVSAAAASQLVEKLVHAGFLQRTEDPNDRRAKLLALSAAGFDLIQKGNQERYRWMDNLAETLSLPDQEKISEALILLTNAAKEMENKNVKKS